jgi:hypothetical protein
VTGVVSVLVVEVAGEGALMKSFRSSKLLIEVGGLRGTSSERRGGRGVAMVVERRRSMAGLEDGGGMLMLARVTFALEVSA